jgi:hypothetical protein
VITGKRAAVLWQVLTAVYARLGFDTIGDPAFEQLVLARIVEPTSKADSLRVLDELGVVHGSLRTMFRSLGRAQERGYRDTVASACFEHASTSGDVSLCLYDVTTLYFEAEHEDELRKVGYSKERRVDPQIIVGLLVDRAGFPLEIGCWEGNKAETATMLPIIRQFQERHSIEAMVVVADAGMLSAGNLKDLHEAGLRFIVGSRATKAPADLASHFPLARGRVHRRLRSSTPSPRGWPPPPRAVSTTRRSGPSRCGTRACTSGRGGRCGRTRPSALPRRQDADVAGEPGQGRDRRGEGCPHPSVRHRQERLTQPG